MAIAATAVVGVGTAIVVLVTVVVVVVVVVTPAAVVVASGSTVFRVVPLELLDAICVPQRIKRVLAKVLPRRNHGDLQNEKRRKHT